MPFVYILESLKDGQFYTGSTIDLCKRLQEHNAGRTPSTKYRRPMKLVYFEEFESLGAARVREKALKQVKAGREKKALVASFPPEKLLPFSN